MILATQTWRNGPGIARNARTPTFPNPAPRAPGPPSRGQAGGPGDSEGGSSGRASEESTVHSGNVAAGPSLPSAAPAAGGRLAPLPRGLNAEQHPRPRVRPAGPPSPPPGTYLGAEHQRLLPCLSLFLPPARDAGGGEDDAHVAFVRADPPGISPGSSRGARRAPGTGAGWQRPPAESCRLRGGRRGPRAGAEDPLPRPPAGSQRRPLLLARGCCVRLGCGGGGVVSLPPTSAHSLVFVAVGSPNAFLSTVLFHYIMSIM